MSQYSQDSKLMTACTSLLFSLLFSGSRKDQWQIFSSSSISEKMKTAANFAKSAVMADVFQKTPLSHTDSPISIVSTGGSTTSRRQ